MQTTLLNISHYRNIHATCHVCRSQRAVTSTRPRDEGAIVAPRHQEHTLARSLALSLSLSLSESLRLHLCLFRVPSVEAGGPSATMPAMTTYRPMIQLHAAWARCCRITLDAWITDAEASGTTWALEQWTVDAVFECVETEACSRPARPPAGRSSDVRSPAATSTGGPWRDSRCGVRYGQACYDRPVHFHRDTIAAFPVPAMRSIL